MEASWWAGGFLAKVRPGRDSGAAGEGCNGVEINDRVSGDAGTFVWSDGDEVFTSTGRFQFLVRARGGFGLNTNAPQTQFHVLGGSRTTERDFWQIIAEGDETSGLAGTGAGISFIGNDGSSTRRLWGHIENVKENSTPGDVRSQMSFYTRGPGGAFPVERLRIDSNGAITTPNGSFTTASDQRLKEKIQPLTESLNTLLALEGVRFRYREDLAPFGDTKPRMGFVAQQVEQVLPEWVSENGEGYKQITPTGFRALAVEAMRELRSEQQKAIAHLEQENAGLRSQLAALQDRQETELADLRAELAMLRDLLAPRIAEASAQ